MEKESIKEAINVLLSSRKAQDVSGGNEQKLPGLEPENTGVLQQPQVSQPNQPKNIGPKTILLSAVNSPELTDNSANTPLFKPGVTNAQIASAALAWNAVDMNKISDQMVNLINTTLTKNGYREGQPINAEQENAYAAAIANALDNYFSSSNFGDSFSLLAGTP